VEILIFKHTS